jgi:hypothetical protein
MHNTISHPDGKERLRDSGSHCDWLLRFMNGQRIAIVVLRDGVSGKLRDHADKYPVFPAIARRWYNSLTDGRLPRPFKM